MPEEKFEGLVIKILSIKFAEVSVILLGFNEISDWENKASKNDPDRLLNRSVLKSPQIVIYLDCSVVKKLIKELNVFMKILNSMNGGL